MLFAAVYEIPWWRACAAKREALYLFCGDRLEIHGGPEERGNLPAEYHRLVVVVALSLDSRRKIAYAFGREVPSEKKAFALL